KEGERRHHPERQPVEADHQRDRDGHAKRQPRALVPGLHRSHVSADCLSSRALLLLLEEAAEDLHEQALLARREPLEGGGRGRGARAAGGVVMRSRRRGRMRARPGGRTRTFTLRSSTEGRRLTRPRDSSRSTRPVTFDLSQARVDASWPIGSCRSGSMRCSRWHWAGESPSSVATEGRFARWAKKSRTRSAQGSEDGGGAGFIHHSIVQRTIVDNLKYRPYIPDMTSLRVVPLDEAVIFPGMSVTLPAEVGDDDRVLLIPRNGSGYAKVGVVAEVAERAALAGRSLASFMPLHRGVPGAAHTDPDGVLRVTVHERPDPTPAPP